MRNLIVIGLIFSSSVLNAASLLVNTREAKSFYIEKSEKRKIERLYKRVSKDKITDEFNDLFSNLNPKEQGCSFSILSSVDEIRKKLKNLNKSKYNESLLYSLRETNLIDDITLGILLKANKLKVKDYTYQVEADEDKGLFRSGVYKNKKQEILSQYDSFEKKLERKSCLDESFSALYNGIAKLDDDFDSREFSKVNKQAFKEGHLSESLFNLIESARKAKIHEWRLNLKQYIKKRSFIKRQLDDEDGLFLDGVSEYITQKDKKEKRSRRERLFEDYDEFQLFMLGKVIRKLRFRMENTDLVTINMINDQGNVIDSVNVDDPMDQFRLYLRLLRVEMNSLSENQVFRNRIPRYSDLITAAFELGYVPAEEVDEVAKLEEIWNPEQTRGEKIWYWVKTFGRVGTVFIPPPYGYIASMAFVAIEQLFMDSDDNNNFDHSLFMVN